MYIVYIYIVYVLLQCACKPRPIQPTCKDCQVLVAPCTFWSMDRLYLFQAPSLVPRLHLCFCYTKEGECGLYCHVSDVSLYQVW